MNRYAFFSHSFKNALLLTAGTSLLVTLSGISECASSDTDGDGYTAENGDCDDSDSMVFPGAPEYCDGVDSNCYASDEPYSTWFVDQDHDGWGVLSLPLEGCEPPENASIRAGDCDDLDPMHAPGLQEVCNGMDDNCNGLADEGLEALQFRDADGDGFGSMSDWACGARAGFIPVRGDCDDAQGDAHPGARDPAGDGRDQDCGGFDGPQPQLGFGANPASSLQAALDAAAAGSTLWVGPGDYLSINVQLPSRPLRLMSTQLAAHTRLNAQQQGRVLLITGGNDAQTLVDGFTLSNGQVSAANGGALFIQGSSPTLQHLILSGNQAIGANNVYDQGNGGAIFMLDSSARLLDVTFTQNRAIPQNNTGTGSGGDGGALYIDGGAPSLAYVHADHNSGVRAGFLYARDTRIDARDISLNANTVVEGAQAIEIASGDLLLLGGTIEHHALAVGEYPVIAASFSNVFVSNMTFQHNRGGIFINAGIMRVTDCTFTDNQDTLVDLNDTSPALYDGTMMYSIVAHTLFMNNVAQLTTWAAPVRLHSSLVNVSFNSFIGNSYIASSGVSDGGYATLNSNLFAYNIGYDVGNTEAISGPILSHNNFYNVTSELSPYPLNMDSSNTTLNPRLVRWTNNEDSADDNPHLLPDSPLHDAGDSDIPDQDGTRAQVGAFGADALPDSYTLDLDQDGLYDGWEVEAGLNPAQNDASQDSDFDELTNLTELQNGLNPTLADSDHDGQPDGLEMRSGSDPLDWYQRASSSGSGVVWVVAHVPGDFASPQAAARAIAVRGEVSLGAGQWPGPLKIHGKSLTLVADPGAVLTRKDETSDTLLQGRFAELTVSGLDIQNGAGVNCPGGFSLERSTAIFQDMTVANHHGDTAAGGIANHSRLTLQRVTFLDNVGDWLQSGLGLSDSSLTFDGLRFLSGEGVALSADSSTIIGQFLEVQGTTYGGIRADSSILNIRQCRITDNTSTSTGSGLNLSDSDVALSHCVITHNLADNGSAPGVMVSGSPTHSFSLDHSIVAYNANLNVNLMGPMAFVSYSNVYNPPGAENTQGLPPSATLTNLDPQFLVYASAGVPSDIHLASASLLINAGDPGRLDADGSRADLGAYGGPDGDLWDRDGDGFEDYFWPGTLSQAPSPFNPADWDAFDQDPSTH